MTVVDTSLHQESRDRYLTYALSVVSGRALPDVRDGLKPVQRRILYAMLKNLGMSPESSHRKSASVVGEVLAKYHPHGDIACYEAMVRMAQDFSLRYPLVDGQGNFGSLDGDSAAAYRYTEVKLKPLAVQVIGEIDEDTVLFRDNFDATVQEPTVLPSRVPNLLINGVSGIAVGMATSIPPHNLRDTVKALIELSKDRELSTARLTSLIKAPDFPTGCQILSTKAELEAIYRTGKGSIRMRGEWKIEEGQRGKRFVVISSIPYAINKAQLVEKIADLILNRRVPQLVDIRDESTEEVRIVAELAPGADPEIAMAYVCKYTPLDTTFPVNLTVLTPTGPGGSLNPQLVSLRECLSHFLDFREQVTVRRLQYERKKLLERLHILEALAIIFDALDEAITIVRKSEGRSDAAKRLEKRFSLSEIQAFAVVDMRIYQLSRTNITELRDELSKKGKRVQEIEALVADPEKIIEIVRADLSEIATAFGDKRRCELIKEAVEVEIKEEDFLVAEDVHAIITRDGWLKRIRQTNDLSGTRLRDGDSILAAFPLSTKDHVVVVTNLGSIYSVRVADFPASSGYGEPIQKVLRFKDGERVIASFPHTGAPRADLIISINEGSSVALLSKGGLGLRCSVDGLTALKRSGKRIAKLREGDEFIAALILTSTEVAVFSRKGYAFRMRAAQLPQREGVASGASVMNLRDDDEVVAFLQRPLDGKITVSLSTGRVKEFGWDAIQVGHRDMRGTKLSIQGEVKEVAAAATVVQ
jgi:DNA gyrase subunit A